MKRISLLFIACTSFVTAAKAQVLISPEAGLNMATMAMKVPSLSGSSYTVNTGMKAGFAVGASADIGVVRRIHFQPGAFYEMAGTKFTASSSQIGGKWDLNTLTVPMNIEYETGKKGGNRFFAGIGPYIAYNVSGNYNYQTNPALRISAETGTLAIGPTEAKDNIKALDLGMGVNAGYLLSAGLYVRVHYQAGFSNLYPDGGAYYSYKTSAFGITIGYYLNSAKRKIISKKA